jgi:DNA gyrase/topoisomerase IV subunit A
MKDGTAKRVAVSDIVGINNWISVGDEPVIDAIIPIHKDDDKFISISDSNKIKISSVESFGKQNVSTGRVKIVQRLDDSKDTCLITTELGKYHMISIKDIPELGRTAAGVMLNVPENEKISMIQIERFTDESGLCTIVDNEGYSYIMKAEQDLLEDTNRANKPKRLFDLSSDYKLTEVNLINTKEKDCKCVLIGKNSSSQITMQNIRSSDIVRVPKKVPVSTIGLVTYKL